jgi:hypothetical protein
MSDVAPQAEDIGQALGYLRMLWGDEFIIGHDDQGSGLPGLIRSASSCARPARTSWATR